MISKSRLFKSKLKKDLIFAEQVIVVKFNNFVQIE